MSKKLFVGGIPYTTTEAELNDYFAQCGNVISCSIIIDRATNRSKGFGFVEYETEEEAQKAVDTLNGTDFGGRTIVVNIARPKEEGGPRSSDRGGDRRPSFGGRRG
jgi:RNA recognition motif-containing protein